MAAHASPDIENELLAPDDFSLEFYRKALNRLLR
jgi:hypothetical protein